MASIYRSAAGEAAVRGWCRAQVDAWPVAHREEQIDAGGLRTHLVVAGEGPDTVVVVAGDRFNVATAGLCRLRLTPGVLGDFAAWAVPPRPATSRRLLHALSGRTPRPALVEWMTLVARHTRPVSAEGVIRPAGGAPTIVATGAHDVFLPPSRLAPAVRSALDGELRVIAAAGHLVTEERPEALRALLEELR